MFKQTLNLIFFLFLLIHQNNGMKLKSTKSSESLNKKTVWGNNYGYDSYGGYGGYDSYNGYNNYNYNNNNNNNYYSGYSNSYPSNNYYSGYDNSYSGYTNYYPSNNNYNSGYGNSYSNNDNNYNNYYSNNNNGYSDYDDYQYDDYSDSDYDDYYEQPSSNNNNNYQYTYEYNQPSSNNNNYYQYYSQPSSSNNNKEAQKTYQPIEYQPAPEGIDLEEIRRESLEVHNQLRAKHHAGPLTLNDDLNNIAQKYAQYLADNELFEHSNNDFKGDYMGENLFTCYGMKLTGKLMTQEWYNEIKDYDFATGKSVNGNAIGHFTQVVWIGSKQLGVGVAKSKNGNYYGVANYYPAGNWVGKYQENVLPE